MEELRHQEVNEEKDVITSDRRFFGFTALYHLRDWAFLYSYTHTRAGWEAWEGWTWTVYIVDLEQRFEATAEGHACIGADRGHRSGPHNNTYVIATHSTATHAVRAASEP